MKKMRNALMALLIAVTAGITGVVLTGCSYLFDTYDSGSSVAQESNASSMEGDGESSVQGGEQLDGSADSSSGNESIDNADSSEESSSQEVVAERFVYRETDDGLVLVGIDGATDGTLEIPDEDNGRAVVGIGEFAFQGRSELTSVVIGNNVTTIEKGAFAYCVNLQDLQMSNSVVSISAYAFSNCSSLTSIYLSENVVSLGTCPFMMCDALTIYCEAEVKPDGWTEYWNAWANYDTYTYPVVWDCKNNDVADDGCVYTVVDGIRFALKDNEATLAPQMPVRKMVIPSSVSYKGTEHPVTCIGVGAFGGNGGLESVTIPDSVTRIEANAFSKCGSLKEIVIPKSVEYIGAYAFNAVVVVCCETENKPSGWSDEWTSSPVVWDCKNNDIASNGAVYTTVDGLWYIFKDGEATLMKQSSDLAEARIVLEVEYKGQKYPVTGFYSATFSGCSSLVSVILPDEITSQAEYSYKIPDSMFNGCSSLTSITIPKGVASIGNSAFSGCSGLTSIVIPEGVTSIGNSAFSGCSGLTSIVIPEGVTSIGNSAFSGCSGLTSITIPGSVTNVGDNLFYGCSALTDFKIPNDAVWVDVTMFYNTGYYNDESNWENDVLYYGNYLISARETISGEYVIKSGTTRIAGNAFGDCDSLTNIVIPEGVTSIGEEAFYGCRNLVSIVIPEGVASIGEYAFYFCRNLASIVIPESVTSIEDATFYNCWMLENVELPNTIRSIGESAFFGTWLTTINLPNTITSIGVNAFANSLLKNVVIPEGVTEIGDDTFAECMNLSSVTIHDGVMSIGKNAFANCISLTEIVIPDSVTSVVAGAFACDWGLTIYCEAEDKPEGWSENWNVWEGYHTYTYPVVWDCKNNDVADDGFVYIVEDGVRYALKDNEATVVRQAINIREAWIAKKIVYDGQEYVVTGIADLAFTNCEILDFVVIPNTVTEIGSSAFRWEYEFVCPTEIFCEAERMPNGWNESWCDPYFSVYWKSLDWEYVDGEIVILG